MVSERKKKEIMCKKGVNWRVKRRSDKRRRGREDEEGEVGRRVERRLARRRSDL